jgi:hypothetical protein
MVESRVSTAFSAVRDALEAREQPEGRVYEDSA